MNHSQATAGCLSRNTLEDALERFAKFNEELSQHSERLNRCADCLVGVAPQCEDANPDYSYSSALVDRLYEQLRIAEQLLNRAAGDLRRLENSLTTNNEKASK